MTQICKFTGTRCTEVGDTEVQTKSLPESASFAQPFFASPAFQDLAVLPAEAAGSVAEVTSDMRLMKWALLREKHNRQGPLTLCVPQVNSPV